MLSHNWCPDIKSRLCKHNVVYNTVFLLSLILHTIYTYNILQSIHFSCSLCPILGSATLQKCWLSGWCQRNAKYKPRGNDSEHLQKYRGELRLSRNWRATGEIWDRSRRWRSLYRHCTASGDQGWSQVVSYKRADGYRRQAGRGCWVTLQRFRAWCSGGVFNVM